MMSVSQKSPPSVQLRNWVGEQYNGQRIKISGEPYMNHLLAVAKMAAGAAPFGNEIGLCHDLLEDTSATPAQLYAALLGFGYTEAAADHITDTVVELTDVFTKAAYPELRKRERKECEAQRWLKLSSAAQTVKYADLLYNIPWVLRYQPGKAKKYIRRKVRLLAKLDKGNPALYLRTLEVIDAALTHS